MKENNMKRFVHINCFVHQRARFDQIYVFDDDLPTLVVSQ